MPNAKQLNAFLESKDSKNLQQKLAILIYHVTAALYPANFIPEGIIDHGCKLKFPCWLKIEKHGMFQDPETFLSLMGYDLGAIKSICGSEVANIFYMYLANKDRTQSGFWKAVVAVIADHEFIVKTEPNVTKRMTGSELASQVLSDPRLFLSFDYDGVTNERNSVQPQLLGLFRSLMKFGFLTTGNSNAYCDESIPELTPVIFVNPQGSVVNNAPVPSVFSQVVALFKIGLMKYLANKHLHIDDSPLCRLLGRCSNGISSKSEDNKSGDTTFILKGQPDHSTLIFKILQKFSESNIPGFDIPDYLMKCLEVIGLKRNSFRFPEKYNPDNINRFIEELRTKSNFSDFLEKDSHKIFRVLLSGPRGLGKTSLGATLAILLKQYGMPVYHITGDISNMGSPATMQAILILIESILLRLGKKAIIIAESVQNKPVVPSHVSQFAFELKLPESFEALCALAYNAYRDDSDRFLSCKSDHVDNTPDLAAIPIDGVNSRNPRPYAYFLAIVKIVTCGGIIDNKLTNELAGLTDDERAEVWRMFFDSYLYTAYFVDDSALTQLIAAVQKQ